jgi:hypothetical protein
VSTEVNATHVQLAVWATANLGKSVQTHLFEPFFF